MTHAMLFGVAFSKAELRNRSVELTPDEAIARDLCPETGAPLEEVNIPDHIARLWPKARSDEAVRRIELLQKWDAAHQPPPAEPAAPAAPAADAPKP